MTTRIVDTAGHGWPVTGHRCPVCRMPTDPVLDDGPHPGCAPTAVPGLDDDQVSELLVRELGATPVRPCCDCGNPLPDHAADGVAVHAVCWSRRPRPQRRNTR